MEKLHKKANELLMDHSFIETTIIYLHSDLCSGQCKDTRFPYGKRVGLFR